MIYDGKAIKVKETKDGIAELVFDLKNESINKFDAQTMREFKEVGEVLESASQIKGLLVTSAKACFIVGADITEFGGVFAATAEEIEGWLAEANALFNRIEDLPYPTVTAINGIALGGGFEMCLSTDYRVMSSTAKVGLPEVKLGIFPGFGGTVRLSRLIGADNAIEWIASGNEKRADAAFKDGAVDAVSAPDALYDTALGMLKRAIAGDLDYRQRRADKTGKLKLISPLEQMMTFETAKAYVAGKAGKHYPAPVEAIKAMQKHSMMDRDKALVVEAKHFAKMAKTEVSGALISLFLNDQVLKKKAKTLAPKAKDVNRAAVIGAGIMGGGIAFQSALKGTPILMKDIQQQGLDLGLKEANKLLGNRVSRGKIDVQQAGEALTRISPTLSYGDFKTVDVIVEAVVENPKVKKSVYLELEDQINPDAIIATNTSTISVNLLAQELKRPENFCGMHFFNPVHRMPLVEVIRGDKTSEETIATVVEYARKIGKTPIVVNDCPGFLVNRVLFPYFAGFAALLKDGADFQQVDKVMERFGWPMGPAYLLDVVGMDVAKHAADVMAEGFPDRMKSPFKSAMDVLFENQRFGQKNGQGFYRYEEDKKGKPKKLADERTDELLASVCDARKDISEEDIIARLMVPMCIETVRCLEDKIVEIPAEADMGLIFGLGFPPFRGGALRYIDTMGMDNFISMAERFSHLGKLYEPTQQMREMAKNAEKYFG
jgi:3-hydroxyacyl-CoA dehydrogenase/enoyl-CoA hydratase/3-hydroxybutyryl-CoA epimerase/enoyl-CoA isomerase